MKKHSWLIYALLTTILWGVWGALIEIPEKAGFPATLGYIIWSLTMIPCAIVGLYIIRWKLEYDLKSILYGLIVGVFGAGGQLILFHALIKGPAYLVFPIISLSPIVTVVLSVLFLGERASKRHWIGIVFAIFAIILMSYQKPNSEDMSGHLWFVLAILVFLAWGGQAFFMKFANNRMKAESIFFYMSVSGLLLAPIAFYMTDFSKEIYLGFKGPYLAAIVQTLNAVGAIMLVYAIRYGKVIIVAPLVNAVAPVITIVLSLVIYFMLPNFIIVVGIVFTIIAVYLIAD